MSDTTSEKSKRLQVLLEEEEYREIKRIAREQRLTLSEWVRRTLRRARRSEPTIESGKKLEVVRAAVEHEYPTADIDRMLEEIERGYLGPDAASSADAPDGTGTSPERGA